VGNDQAAVLTVPEIRDYQRINAELTVLLDEGRRHVRLAGVEGQRLLVFGLKGSWRAVVEVDGHAGPELAARLDAPGLTVVCRGDAADGAGSGLRAGRLLVLGSVGAAVGYAMRGGTVVVAGDSGPRAGLDQAGGTIVLNGAVGRLAAERQAGGLLIARDERLGPHAGLGHRGGRFLRLVTGEPLAAADHECLTEALADLSQWLPGEPDEIERRLLKP
jgi:glutamate synthase domain-containing protein 3